MRSDPFRSVITLERRHPKAARVLAMVILSLLSPFNAHLKARMATWNDNSCEIALKRRRRVKNHVGSIHAGALFTLGETCAGLVIIRNFPFAHYRPLMSEVRVTYAKQARGDVIGEATIADDEVARMKAVIAQGEIPFTEVRTVIRNAAGESVAEVLTVWQVKNWSMVRSPSS